MEEKGTNTNSHKLSFKSNSNLYLFDEYYYKQKNKNKDLRCKSAINHQSLPFNVDINNILGDKIQKKNIIILFDIIPPFTKLIKL